MNQTRESPLEAGCIGGCVGLVAGVVSIPLFFVLAPLGVALGYEAPVDGNTGLGILAAPIAWIGGAASAYLVAGRGGRKLITVGGAILGFALFWLASYLFLRFVWLGPASL